MQILHDLSRGGCDYDMNTSTTNGDNSKDIGPELTFKIPNFIGSLSERRRPKFGTCLYFQFNSYHASLDFSEEDAKPQTSSLIHNEPTTLKVQEHVSPPTPTPTPNNQELTPIRPINLFKNMRSNYAHEPVVNDLQEDKQYDKKITHEKISSNYEKHGDHQHQILSSSDGIEMSQGPKRETLDRDFASHQYHGLITPSSSSINVSKKQIPQKRAMDYSEEADYYLNQIVSLLAHFRALGKSGFERAIHLDMELKLERENLNQQISLMYLEKQAKISMSEEIKFMRATINELQTR